MKMKLFPMILMITTLGFALMANADPEKDKKKGKPSATVITAKTIDVLKMKTIPDGHYLIEMEQERVTNLVNFEVKNGELKAISSELESAIGMSGRSMLIGNGVFMVQVRNKTHASTQFWVFSPDGNATLKEIPDRGEKHRVWKVKDATVLKRPEKFEDKDFGKGKGD